MPEVSETQRPQGVRELRRRLVQLGDVSVGDFVREVRTAGSVVVLLLVITGILGFLIYLAGLAVDWLRGALVGQTQTPIPAVPRALGNLLWGTLAVVSIAWLVRAVYKLGVFSSREAFKDTFPFIVGIGAIAGFLVYLGSQNLPNWAVIGLFGFSYFGLIAGLRFLDRVPELAKRGEERAQLRVELRRALGESVVESSYLDEEFLLALKYQGLHATLTDESEQVPLTGVRKRTMTMGSWVLSVVDENGHEWGHAFASNSAEWARSRRGSRQARTEALARAWVEALTASNRRRERENQIEEDRKKHHAQHMLDWLVNTGYIKPRFRSQTIEWSDPWKEVWLNHIEQGMEMYNIGLNSDRLPTDEDLSKLASWLYADSLTGEIRHFLPREPFLRDEFCVEKILEWLRAHPERDPSNLISGDWQDADLPIQAGSAYVLKQNDEAIKQRGLLKEIAAWVASQAK